MSIVNEYELGKLRLDRGEFVDKANHGADPNHPDFVDTTEIRDGVADARQAFVNAQDFAAQYGLPIIPSPGTYRIASNLTISSPIVLFAGVVLKPDSGVTVTISGAAFLNEAQATHFTGDGTVSLTGVFIGPGSISSVAVSGITAGINGQFVKTAGGVSTWADLAASDIQSGTLANARVAETNVTQHQAALAVAQSQLTGGANGQYIRHQSGTPAWTDELIDKGGAVYNVKHPDFGAVGDGVTDDTAAIQAAIDAAELVRGTVLFPNGEYLISSTLVVDQHGVTLQGVSRSGASGSSTGCIIKASQTDSTDALALRNSTTRVVNLQFIGPGKAAAGTGRGIYIDDLSGATPTQGFNRIEWVTVRSFPGHGVEAVKPEALSMVDVTSQDNGDKGVYLHDGGLNIGIDVTLERVRCDNNGGTYQLHCDTLIGVTLINCQALNGTAGNSNAFLQNCTNCNVIGGDYEAGGDIGLFVSGSGHTISGPIFYSVTTGLKLGSAQNCVVSNLRAASGLTYILEVDSGCSGIVVLSLQDASTSGVNLNANAEVIRLDSQRLEFTRTRMVQERLSFTDQDATPSVANGNVFSTANTVATTITALDDGRDGQQVTVIFGDANTTIDFTGTNLKGNGGADWSPANGDHMTCVYDGTNWYCNISDNTA